MKTQEAQKEAFLAARKLARVLLDALKETRMAANQGTIVLDKYTLEIIDNAITKVEPNWKGLR